MISKKQQVADVDSLQKIIDKSKSIVFFGGAGVSTESGIPDFRSRDGLYNLKWAYPPEELKKCGISASMIRFSIGIEHADDIIADMDQALSKI